ncbi:MAG: peptide deformylase [Firmicutes bacterium]|nr:peptide deformylase [Bacillota bacterium]
METIKKTIENDEEYLRKISKPIDFKNDDLKTAIETLEYYCTNNDNNLAIAANQLGMPLRLIYLKKTDIDRLDEDYNEARILINPKIIKSEGLTTYWEACASCLDLTGLVKRPYKIEVEYYDINKIQHIETFIGFSATVLSHEIDHLDGILHIDIAEEVLDMTQEERKKFRKNNPYKVLREDGEYIHPTNNKSSLKHIRSKVK